MKVLFAGSFDPFTVGHLDIVDRALKIFGSVLIGIGYNENKSYNWDIETRQKAISSLFEGNAAVSVKTYRGLTIDFARKEGVSAIVRGVRSVLDYEYEKTLADVNKEISGIETLLLLAEPSLSFISSSMVRELIHNGYDASKYIAGTFPPLSSTKH